MSIIKKYPLPIAGLILALFTLGNLLGSINPLIKTFIGIIAGVLYLLFVLKFILNFSAFREGMQAPPVASVLPTITMATMLIATYLKPVSDTLAQVFWWMGLCGQIFLILLFSYKYVIKFKIKTVFPSWFIVYVGIAVAGVTAPAVDKIEIGQLSFYFALVSYVILLPAVLYRIWKVKELPPPTLPSLTIVAAPASLLLAAYLNTFPEKNLTLLWALIACSLIFFTLGFYYMLMNIFKKFIPSMSGFTFPMAISAVSIAGSNGFFVKAGNPQSFLAIIAQFEMYIATAAVAYVLFGYLVFLFKSEAPAK